MCRLETASCSKFRGLRNISVVGISVCLLMFGLLNYVDKKPSNYNVLLSNLITHRSSECECSGAAKRVNDSELLKVCRSALLGETVDPAYRSLASRFTPLSDSCYVQRLKAVISYSSRSCECFRAERQYFTADDVTLEERNFPIAFSLLTYENVEQTERLLRLVYRPHNVYCIHVDKKSPGMFRRAVESIANCLENVFVTRDSVDVRWGQISIVDAELTCMKQLLEHSVNWKYFINLVGRDFPLRTNAQLVEILKAYNGSNDIRGTREL